MIAYVKVPSVLSCRSTPEYSSDTSHGEMGADIASQTHSYPEDGNDDRTLQGVESHICHVSMYTLERDQTSPSPGIH